MFDAYLAKNEQDRQLAMQLRYHFLCKLNDYEEDKGDVNSVVDEFSPYDHFILISGDNRDLPYGVVRMITSNPIGFDTQNYVDISKYFSFTDRDLEIAEWIVDPRCKSSTVVLPKMLAAVLKFINSYKPNYMFSLATPETKRVMMRAGAIDTNDYVMTPWKQEMVFMYCDGFQSVIDYSISRCPKVFRKKYIKYLESE